MSVRPSIVIAVALACVVAESFGCTMDHVESSNSPRVGDQPTDRRAVLAAGPPELILPRGGDSDPISGKLLVVDWGELTQGIDIRPGDRFQWPSAQNRHDHSVFHIISAVQPYWIQVNLFAAIDAESGMPVDPQTGQLTELPIYEYECQGLDGDRRYPEVRNGVVSIDAIPDSPLPNEYVTVFVAWTVPFTQEELDVDPAVAGNRVFASWMFHFANE